MLLVRPIVANVIHEPGKYCCKTLSENAARVLPVADFCRTIVRTFTPMTHTSKTSSSWKSALLRDSHFWIPLGVLIVGLILLFRISNWSLS